MGKIYSFSKHLDKKNLESDLEYADQMANSINWLLTKLHVYRQKMNNILNGQGKPITEKERKETLERIERTVNSVRDDILFLMNK